jgi:hypothetical protein
LALPQTSSCVPDTGQRGPQVAVDVVGQGFHGGYVKNPAPSLGRRRGLVQKPIEYPEKRRQRFSTSGGGVDQGVRAGGDVPPSLFLGQSRLRK